MWPKRSLIDLLGVEHPIVQAPMAGSNGVAMAVAAAEAGALGSLPCGMLTPDEIRDQVEAFRQRSDRPLHLNFFTHRAPADDPEEQKAWRRSLAGYYAEYGIDPESGSTAPSRSPFDEARCRLVEDFRPEVVSFHFGLPEAGLLARVKAAGCKVLSSATSVAEARWLEAHGVDAVIAQGNEAGGHRGIFLDGSLATQPGTFALVPQVADAIALPVIAAGGIGDGRGIAAAFALGAAGVSIGTGFLLAPEALSSKLHQAAVATAGDQSTAVTNLLSGRPARGVMNRLMRELGPLSDAAPAFPTAGGALAPLKAAAEARGEDSFSILWAGQSVALARRESTAEIIERLVRDASARLSGLAAVAEPAAEEPCPA